MLSQQSINNYNSARRGTDDTVIIEGYHALKHALRFDATIIDLYKSEESGSLSWGNTVRDDDTLSYIAEHAHILPHETFLSLAPHAGRTGIIARATKPDPTPLQTLLADKGSPLVILEDPRDLDNIGACIRVAAARGCRGLLISGSSNPWHAHAIRSGAGCSWAFPVQGITDGELSKILMGETVFACSDEGTGIYDMDVPQDAIYVFGTEREGINPKTRSNASHIISLPMRAGISSLNLATSVSAILYANKF